LAEASAATHHATPNNHAGLIWAIADLLRGDYKQSEYGRVILPLILLRRLDCVLEPTKAQVLARVKTLTVQTVGPVLKTVAGMEAYNTSAPGSPSSTPTPETSSRSSTLTPRSAASTVPSSCISSSRK
jgi:HsdM N-terminal domain